MCQELISKNRLFETTNTCITFIRQVLVVSNTLSAIKSRSSNFIVLGMEKVLIVFKNIY